MGTILRFNVGDDVIVSGKENGHQFEMGEKVKIIEVSEDNYRCINKSGENWYLVDYELSPAPLEDVFGSIANITKPVQAPQLTIAEVMSKEVETRVLMNEYLKLHVAVCDLLNEDAVYRFIPTSYRAGLELLVKK